MVRVRDQATHDPRMGVIGVASFNKREGDMSAKFERQKAADGHFHFHLKAANGEIIFSSQEYKAKASALGGIESVKANAHVDAHFERKTSHGEQPYFVLKAANGETVGCS